MASSSSSSSPRTWEYNVFTSFHGPDVRKTLLSHLRKQFSYNGITMFNDNGIERSQIIAPALTKAIGESRIAIVLLSKNYASSSWCLDELLEILKCKEELGQIVMTVFYGVDPSDVRKQTGDFGIAFNETCARKTEEQRRKWSQALTYVGNIAGEDFKNWDNEAEMIEKIAGDVSDKVNATPCRDFDGMVGLDDHLRKMEYLLDLDNLGVKIVGISGPAGIGKSTIARALHSRLSSKFQHNCFVDNLWENYKIGSGEHGVKLRLHGKLLSELLNINHMQISHLGVIKDRLHDKKVLIILDDVESLAQLEALADITWFGPGSRVIVTTENRKILQQHSISDSDIYHVGFPSESKAVMIFCLSAFKQTSPPDGFMNLTYEVVRICGNLPLALSVLGSSLRGKGQDDWFDELPRLRNRLDGRIESVLKVGYESLDEKDQALFLLIAVFFNYKHVDYVTSMLENTNVVDVRLGLKNLADRHLIHKYRGGVVMHRLLQVMAREVMSKEKISKRKILEDPQDICYVLQEAKGKGSTLAVSLDVGKINELKVNKKAFKRMSNLLILKVFDGMHFDWMHFDGMHRRESKLHVPEEMEFPPSLRLLHWVAYPSKSLRFRPENLIKLYMPDSQLEKLWEGTQPLANLKKMDLSLSFRLKVLPDLSKATNLEELDVSLCYALEEIPSSVSNLHKLVKLEMDSCDSLEVIPTLVNLASMKRFKLSGCSRLRSFPDVPTSLTELLILNTWLEELPASFRHCSRLRSLQIRGRENLKIFATHLPTSVTELNLSNSVHIERITDCIKGLNNLTQLDLSYCRRLVSLPELPGSLKWLSAENCTSLERVSDPLNTPHATLYFMNCIKLDRQAREAIIKQSFVPLDGWALIPGREIPTEFDHRTTGNSLTIHHSAFNRFVKVCVVISSIRNHRESTAHTEYSQLWYRCRVSNNLENSVVKNFILSNVSDFLMDHLIIFHASLPFFEHSEASRDIVLQFSSEEPFHQQRYSAPIFNIIECGVQILTDEPDRSNNGGYDLLWDTSKSKSSEALDKEDDEEGDKSESGEGSEDIDEDIDETDRFNNGGYDLLWDTSESESSEASDKEDDEEGDKSESGEASEDIDEDITNEGDYEYVSRKRPRTTMITDLKWGIQRRRF